MKTRVNVKCTEPGCFEYARFEYDTRRDAAEHFKTRREWKCTRHSNPHEVLSPDNRETVTGLVNKALPIGKATKLFWNGHNGFSSGPGFKAFAADFPEGTKLIITARIELPDPAPTVARNGADGRAGE